MRPRRPRRQWLHCFAPDLTGPCRLPEAQSAQIMRSATHTGSIASLIDSLIALGERLYGLFLLEAREAGPNLAWTLALALCAAVLAITGWLALVACSLLALVHNNIVGWGWAFFIAALLSIAGAGVLIHMLIGRSRQLLFPATSRQVGQFRDGPN